MAIVSSHPADDCPSVPDAVPADIPDTLRIRKMIITSSRALVTAVKMIGSVSLAVCSEVRISSRPRVQFHITDVAYAGQIHHHSLKSQAVTRMAA